MSLRGEEEREEETMQEKNEKKAKSIESCI